MNLTGLRQEIINIINMSELPIDGIYFVLKDILNETVSIYNKQLNDMAVTATSAKEEAQLKETENVASAENQKEE